MVEDGAQLAETLDRLDSVEQELAALQQEVRHTDALATVGGLAAGLAHELNNLLTPALTYAQLAERSPDDPKLVAKALRRTVEAIQTATRMLDATLDLATPDGAKAPGWASVAETLDAAIACLTRDPARDAITVERAVDASLRVRITPQELQQVFVNLLTNATRVLRRRGGGTIRVEASRMNAMVRIEVVDDGPGIPAGIRNQLFRPFVTTETPQDGRPEEGGRGLGLAICQRTIAARRGSISVDDAERGGARFTIVLPQLDEDGAREAA